MTTYKSSYVEDSGSQGASKRKWGSPTEVRPKSDPSPSQVKFGGKEGLHTEHSRPANQVYGTHVHGTRYMVQGYIGYKGT